MNEDNTMILVFSVLVVLLLWLMSKREFWLTIFFFAMIASFFAMIASIFSFQILGAIGFMILTSIMYRITVAIDLG